MKCEPNLSLAPIFVCARVCVVIIRYDLPPSRAWAIAHNLDAAVRLRSRPSRDPFGTRAAADAAALAAGAGAAPKKGAGAADSFPAGFSGYDTLSSDEEAGEAPWRADVDGFALPRSGSRPGAQPPGSSSSGSSSSSGVGVGGVGAGGAAPVGSVFGHGGGLGALDGGGEVAAAQRAVCRGKKGEIKKRSARG